MNIAIILAGGIGTRMQESGFPKQYMQIKGKPVLIYTLERFEACPDVDKIVVVAHKQWEENILNWVEQYHIHKFVCVAPQGDTRQESVFHGLLACEQLQPDREDLALVHDAARPLVTPGLISRCVAEAQKRDGCLPVISVKDTIYYSVDGHAISGLTDRSTLFCGQSPEAFKLLRYLELNKNTPKEDLQQIRGSCELAFQGNLDIGMIPGEEMNFKLTTKEDMERLCAVLETEG